MRSLLQPRGMYSAIPPDIRTRLDDNPTLLVSWWATGVSLAIIVTRVCGRYVRIERLFREDKIMMASIIPLLVRMAFVHVVLIYGTNNTKVDGLTDEDIRHREIGSRLVLAARIFYAIFIWMAKLTVCEFLNRIAGITWRRSLRIFLISIYYFLGSTLLAVVIATLAECQPFSHHWQVVPDPGPTCRSGYANVITMGACDIITDLLLVAFPIPLVWMTNMPKRRRIALAILFALSLILVAITSYRVPSVIQHKGSQQYRSLLASLEILAATAVSNVVVISSFVRDKGVKKIKYKNTLASASINESLDHSSNRRATITHHHWGSDSDLARDMGIRLDPELVSRSPTEPRPAPIATGGLDPNWTFSRQTTEFEDDESSTGNSLDIKVSPHDYLRSQKTTRGHSPSDDSPDQVPIFDVGGLLTQPTPPSTSHHHDPNHSYLPPSLQNPTNSSGSPSLRDVGGLLSSSGDITPLTTASASQYLLHSSPNPRPGGLRRGSQQGRRRSSVHFSDSPDSPVPSSRTQSGVSGTIFENADEFELQDVGGLLSKKP
ncbi:putative integral membrane protein Pth11-like [Aspergillus undulatus]|uniref:putative integral membrane protein Pth11-like n=1 Tax=Aspergillus undulatus TaxID=1810928 RepID=UPI003CCCA382